MCLKRATLARLLVHMLNIVRLPTVAFLTLWEHYAKTQSNSHLLELSCDYSGS